jgi:cytochrome c-type biogenesis protein CcmH
VRGPSAEDVQAAEKMSAADRQRMIEDMVQGLAERLAKDGRDLAGWQRLIRAYAVMGRKDDAVAALGKARGNFTDEPQSLGALADLAKALGLES